MIRCDRMCCEVEPGTESKKQTNSTKYFISMLDTVDAERFAEGVKSSIVRAVKEVEKPSDTSRKKVDLTTLKVNCHYSPESNYVVTEIITESVEEPLPYDELLAKYIELKEKIKKSGWQE